MSNKIITWKSWNAMADDYIMKLYEDLAEITTDLSKSPSTYSTYTGIGGESGGAGGGGE